MVFYSEVQFAYIVSRDIPISVKSKIQALCLCLYCSEVFDCSVHLLTPVVMNVNTRLLFSPLPLTYHTQEVSPFNEKWFLIIPSFEVAVICWLASDWGMMLWRLILPCEFCPVSGELTCFIARAATLHGRTPVCSQGWTAALKISPQCSTIIYLQRNLL